MPAHSSIVGGSTVARLLACAGSYQAILNSPAIVDVPSEYALEGTFAHAVMQAIMQRWRAGHNPHMIALQLLGTHFEDRVLTQDHLDNLILPALDNLLDLIAQYGGNFKVLGIEQRVRFPGVPGGFGTVDLILRSKTHVIVLDWKFGAGNPVFATYPVSDDEEIVNPQLMFYATAAERSLNLMLGRRTLVVAIVQPRSETPLTHTIVSGGELDAFRDDVEQAVVRALDRDPPLNRGPHCQWAPCKPTCRMWTGPLKELIELAGDPEPRAATTSEVTPYAEYLAAAKYLSELARDFAKDIDTQMMAYLDAGGTIPGWRLKLKSKMRQWTNEAEIVAWMRANWFSEDEIWQRKLQTFAAADKAAKLHGVKIPDSFRVAPPSTEVTLATSDDPAPPVDRKLALQQFAAALDQIEGAA